MSKTGEVKDSPKQDGSRWILMVFVIVFLAAIIVGPSAIRLWMQSGPAQQDKTALSTQSH